MACDQNASRFFLDSLTAGGCCFLPPFHSRLMEKNVVQQMMAFISMRLVFIGGRAPPAAATPSAARPSEGRCVRVSRGAQICHGRQNGVTQ